MLRFENVATPAVAATVAVPASVPPPGFVAIATVTFAVKLVTVLPSPSSTVTCTAGVIAAPATALVGSPVNTRAVADPAETLNAALPPVARPVPLAVSVRSEEHTSELQSHSDLVCRLLLEKKKNKVQYADMTLVRNIVKHDIADF